MLAQYGGVQSIGIQVPSRVPQGSNLGPLPFNIFMNDIINGNVMNTIEDCLEIKQEEVLIHQTKRDIKQQIQSTPSAKRFENLRKSSIVNSPYRLPNDWSIGRQL